LVDSTILCQYLNSWFLQAEIIGSIGQWPVIIVSVNMKNGNDVV
jgi:hypothetical protein